MFFLSMDGQCNYYSHILQALVHSADYKIAVSRGMNAVVEKMIRTIGSRIKRAREAAGLNQRELGERLGGLTPQAVTKWESGDTKPSLINVVQISQVTNVSVQWLLFGDLKEQDKNGSIPAFLGRGMVVPVMSLENAVHRLLPNDDDVEKGYAQFECSPMSFAVDLVDDSNAPIHPASSRWIIDPELPPLPGSMVLAAYGKDRRPVFGELHEETTAAGLVVIVKPLNPKWASARSDVQELDIIGAMAQSTIAARR